MQEIISFMEYISVEDPEAIVVFQADHGLHAFEISNKLIKNNTDVTHRANVFNAIKAPESCFDKFGEPYSTVNTIRFVLNCSYGIDLPYKKIIHYNIEKKWPKVHINEHIF